MHTYHELERELQHIKACIALLEQTQAYLFSKTPAADPAYWKARLKAINDERLRNFGLEKHALELLARVDRLHARSRATAD